MKKILVVDNHPVMLKFMETLLEKQGHHVLTAEDGLSALDILDNEIPDVIFIDLIMPNINGEKLCKIIRSMPRFKQTYVVIQTAIAAEEEIDFTEFGADACIAKGPFGKMKENILAVIKSSDHRTPRESIVKTLGLEDVYHREVTKELLFFRRHSEIILANMGEGILELNAAGKVIYANPAAIVLAAIAEERLLGIRFTDLFFGENHKRVQAELTSIQNANTPGTVFLLVELNEKQVSLRIISVRDKEHNAIIVILNDIDEKKRVEAALRESEERFKTIFKHANDLILYLAPDGKIVDVNDKSKDIMGYEKKFILGKHVSDFDIFRNTKEKKNGQFISMLLGGDASNVIDFEAIRKDGSTIFLEGNSTILRKDDHIVGILVIIRDITSRKMAAEKLRETNRALELSLKTLKETQSQLVESGKMAALGGLVAGVAHEINTPLGVGITAVSFLYDKTQALAERFHEKTLDQAEIEKYVPIATEATSMILTNLNRAASLIGSFKQVAIDQLREEKRKFLMKECIDELLFSLRPKYRNADVEFIIECSDNLELDSYPGVYSQIMTNLILNSLLHGFEDDTHGVITITLSEKDDILHFNYSDNGKGMTKEQLKMLYDPFFTTNRSHGGTGLGMHIVYNLVTQKLGGKIQCTSSPKSGTKFYITAPLLSSKT